MIEYKVREVTRYIVTRFENEEDPITMKSSGSSSSLGEFDRFETAYDVGYALCKKEHDDLGYPPGDDRIQYPKVKGHEFASACMSASDGATPRQKLGFGPDTNTLTTP